MTTTAAVREHQTLVQQRALRVLALKENQLTQAQFDSDVKKLDARIGRLAQATNPRIAQKAQAWFDAN